MINLGLSTFTLEEAVDVIAEILLSPDFAQALTLEHERARRKIPFRFPEVVYTEDVSTPSGYPCCELVSMDSRDQRDSTATALTHEISAQWTVNGDDEQAMGREVKRLIEATRNYFRSAKLLPLLGGSLWTGDADFGPVLAARQGDNTSGRFVKSASIAIFWQAYTR